MFDSKYIRKEELTAEHLFNDFYPLLCDNYFLYQYGLRKFLSDDNVLFDENAPEWYKNFIIENYTQKSKMIYSDIVDYYDSVLGHLYDLFYPSEMIRKFNKEVSLIESQDKVIQAYKAIIKDLKFQQDEKVQIIIAIIKQLQWAVIYYNDEIFKDDKQLFITDVSLDEEIKTFIRNPEICRELLKDEQIRKNILFFNNISTRYGVMITSLCSENFKILDCNQELSIQDISSCPTFFSHKMHKKSKQEEKKDKESIKNFDFNKKVEELSREKVLNNSTSTKDFKPYNGRTQDFLSSMISKDKIKTSSYLSIKKTVKDIYTLSRSDMKLRRAGLLIWDLLHNPYPVFESIRKENNIKNPTDAR